MTRLSQLPGPGDFRIPDPECVKVAAESIALEVGDVFVIEAQDWCDTHDQPWRECGGMEPNYDDEPVAP